MRDETTNCNTYNRAAMEAQRLVSWTGDTLSLTLQYLRLLNVLAELEEEYASQVYISRRRALKRRIDDLNAVLAALRDVLDRQG